jgi:hypothetical protein
MNQSLFSTLIIRSIWLTSIVGALTGIALADQTKDQVAEKSAEAVTGKFVSDGAKFDLEKVGLSIVPPAGWEVITSSPSLSLIMQEPAAEKIEYNKPIFQRNITVAAVHQPAPIDEQRAIKLREELMATFGKDGVVKDYQVTEHKFFNYRAKNDGLLIFAQFSSGEFQMTQIHVLVSGSERQFLMTYTDLAERFSAVESYEKAWNSMMSLEVSGLAPQRYADLKIAAAVAGSLILLFGALMFFRRRKSYMDDADEAVYSDEPVTQSEAWNLSTTSTFSSISKPANEKTSAKGEGFSFVTGF